MFSPSMSLLFKFFNFLITFREVYYNNLFLYTCESNVLGKKIPVFRDNGSKIQCVQITCVWLHSYYMWNQKSEFEYSIIRESAFLKNCNTYKIIHVTYRSRLKNNNEMDTQVIIPNLRKTTLSMFQPPVLFSPMAPHYFYLRVTATLNWVLNELLLFFFSLFKSHIYLSLNNLLFSLPVWDLR